MIEVNALTFAYPHSDTPTINQLNFHIEKGEIFGFLGPSGAGKSTTQKILIGLLKSYQGNVSILNKPLKSWDASLYEKIGVSFELPNHFLKLTARENLAYFGRLYDKSVRQPTELLELLGLAEDADTPVGQFSKGMKNRLTVARALLHNPDVLFLDEPTAGLDPANARRIKDLIRAQQQSGKTVFLTTHDMSVADELCDRLAFITAGEIRLIDAPQTLKIQYGQHRVRVEYLNDARSKTTEFPLENIGENNQFLTILQQHEIRTIHTLEASLEEIFIKVTGQELR